MAVNLFTKMLSVELWDCCMHSDTVVLFQQSPSI